MSHDEHGMPHFYEMYAFNMYALLRNHMRDTTHFCYASMHIRTRLWQLLFLATLHPFPPPLPPHHHHLPLHPHLPAALPLRLQILASGSCAYVFACVRARACVCVYERDKERKEIASGSCVHVCVSACVRVCVYLCVSWKEESMWSNRVMSHEIFFWKYTYKCVTWLVHMCDMTYSYVSLQRVVEGRVHVT